jgi:hypothetical protein
LVHAEKLCAFRYITRNQPRVDMAAIATALFFSEQKAGAAKSSSRAAAVVSIARVQRQLD